MKNCVNKALYLLTSFVLLCARVHGAVTRAIQSDQWDKLTKDDAWGYRNEVENIPEPEKHTPSSWNGPDMRWLGEFLTSKTFYTIAWIAVISLVLYLAYRYFFVGMTFFGKENKTLEANTAPGEQPEDIGTGNWERLMHQAAKNNDLRLAVRYSYMWLLQILQNKELIQYRNDKTNYDYYRELAATNYKQPFKQLSRQYEYTWYGHFAMQPETYEQYVALFNSVKKQLGA